MNCVIIIDLSIKFLTININRFFYYNIHINVRKKKYLCTRYIVSLKLGTIKLLEKVQKNKLNFNHLMLGIEHPQHQ